MTTIKTTVRKKTNAGKSTRDLPRPFLKWAGGKGQLVDDLLALVPRHFNNYYEPFLGGGALFFAMYRKGLLEDKDVHLSDINTELMYTYLSIKEDLQSVVRKLKSHKYEKNYYYKIRSQDPSKLFPDILAARMIFLNKTGFNGLYRVNSMGFFNVPFGRYKNPQICDKENLKAVSRALEGVDIHITSFENILNIVRRGDFVYLDPPYVPMSETAHFVGYHQNGFGADDQERLAQVFEKLDGRGVHVMLSNSDTPWVRKRYKAFRQVRFDARRSINSKAGLRGPVGELVIIGNATSSN